MKPAIILCLILLFRIPARAAEKRSGPPLNSVAPAFALPNLEGRRVELNQFKGRTVVLNFWAFWCDTWREEMPHLRELVKQQKEQKFQLLCISVDGARLQEFLDDTGGHVPFPVLLDFRGVLVLRLSHILVVITWNIEDIDGINRD